MALQLHCKVFVGIQRIDAAVQRLEANDLFEPAASSEPLPLPPPLLRPLVEAGAQLHTAAAAAPAECIKPQAPKQPRLAGSMPRRHMGPIE
jgi:hypothetical protein